MQPRDTNAGSQNKFVATVGGGAGTINPNQGERSTEDAADGVASPTGADGDGSVGQGTVGNRPGPLAGHGYLSKSDRPYAGSLEGRIEDREDDAADAGWRHQAAKDEASTIGQRSECYNQHGNVGWAGNYAIDWKVER